MMCEECQAALLLLTDYSLYDSNSLFFQIVGQMFNVFLNSVIQWIVNSIAIKLSGSANFTPCKE